MGRKKPRLLQTACRTAGQLADTFPTGGSHEKNSSPDYDDEYTDLCRSAAATAADGRHATAATAADGRHAATATADDFRGKREQLEEDGLSEAGAKKTGQETRGQTEKAEA